MPMRLKSPAFSNETVLPIAYTCDGNKINPLLEISSAPADAASLALIMDDPDAPSGAFVHWTLWNMDPKTAEIQEASKPPGAIEGVTSMGIPGYVPPCPPFGRHHYRFTLYALDTRLDLRGNATKDDLVAAMEGHILEQNTLIGLYH